MENLFREGFIQFGHKLFKEHYWEEATSEQKVILLTINKIASTVRIKKTHCLCSEFADFDMVSGVCRSRVRRRYGLRRRVPVRGGRILLPDHSSVYY